MNADTTQTYNEILVSEEILLRQVNPAFVQDGRIGSSVFEPSKKDNDHLSCSQKKLIVEKESHQIYTTVKNFKSCGVASVSIGEVAVTGLAAFESKISDADKFDQAHAHIDFSKSASKNERKNKAKALAEKARQRGVSWFDAESNPVDLPVA